MNKDDILFYAFRYALGRSTYVVGQIVDEIIERWDTLDEQDQSQYKREIVEAIELKPTSMKMDVKEWQRILDL